MTGNARKIVDWLMQEIREHPDKEYECVEKKNKRSLDANSYYWSLVGKLADALNESKNRIHNRMLRRYGQLERINDKIVTVTIPDTDDAEETAMESETYHIKPTSKVQINSKGITYRVYYMLKGSHDFDSKEFSILLDGLISEAKEQGIETLPPMELEKMKAELRKQEEKKHGKKE